MVTPRLSVCLTIALALVPLGCGPRLASVTGKVVFPDKTPMATGVVVFDPADSNPYSAQGLIQSDGSFRLGVNQSGEGAHPGKYKVAVEQHDESKPLEPRFGSSSKSGLELTVEPGSNDFTITVELRKKR